MLVILSLRKIPHYAEVVPMIFYIVKEAFNLRIPSGTSGKVSFSECFKDATVKSWDFINTYTSLTLSLISTGVKWLPH